jgi:hypothetical protein
VLVTVVPAKTANDVAVPNPTWGWAANADGVPANPPKIIAAAVPNTGATANQRRGLPARANRNTDVTDFPPQRTSRDRTSASLGGVVDRVKDLGWLVVLIQLVRCAAAVDREGSVWDAARQGGPTVEAVWRYRRPAQIPSRSGGG